MIAIPVCRGFAHHTSEKHDWHGHNPTHIERWLGGHEMELIIPLSTPCVKSKYDESCGARNRYSIMAMRTEVAVPVHTKSHLLCVIIPASCLVYVRE
jgi:hypothetical protein